MRGTESPPAARKSPEAGFSFVEILVALLLASALGLVLWSGLSGAQGLARKTMQRTSLAVKLLQMDTALRRELGRVRIPYWLEPESAAREEGGRLVLSCLDADPQARLTLELRGGRLHVARSGGAPLAFGPFPEAGLRLFRDTEGRPLGVEVQVRMPVERGGESIVLLARFGSNPL